MAVRIRRLSRAVALVGLLVALPAHADGSPPPTSAQLARARQAFAEGKKLHDAGKLAEAIERFKQSYELSRNPLLLYNIGLTMQELGSDDLAAVYFRKFLAEDTADAAQRQDAGERIAAISRKLGATAAPAAAAAGAPGDPAAPAAATPSDSGFAHQPIESTPPGQPLDLVAALPDDSPLAVTLFFRTPGQAAFTSTPMQRRNHELVGRIPASWTTGSALHYYLEARDPSGAIAARSGKSTAPNIVAIDPAAPPRFYPDVAEPVLAPAAPPAPATPSTGDVEDPLAHAGAVAPTDARGDGWLDAGSQRFAYAKWSTTALAGVGIGLGVTMYVLARNHASALEDDATGCAAPPCQVFDDFDRSIQRTGKLEQTISNVALFGGIAVAAVAGYFWYRDLTAGPDDRASPPGPAAHAAATAARARRSSALRWLIAPLVSPGRSAALGSGVTGAAAAVRF